MAGSNNLVLNPALAIDVTNNLTSLNLGSNKTASATLHVGGSVLLGSESSSTLATCDGNRLGAIKYATNQFYVCRSAATGWEVMTAGSASTTTAMADRIVSGTNVAVINSTTGIISLSTTSGSTSWGYLAPTGLSYLPGLFTTTVSSGLVSASAVSLTTSDYNQQTVTNVVGSGGNQIVSGTSNVTVNGGSNNTISFTTAGTTRMTVAANGYVGIGTSSPNAPLHIAAFVNQTRGPYGALYNGGSGATYVNTTQSIPISIQADQRIVAPEVDAISDRRLKTNIQPLADALERLSQITGVTFNWKNRARDPRQQVGVIAQNVQQVYPQLVSADASGTLSVNYSGLVAPLIESVKELKKQNDDLRALVAKQGAAIDALLKTNPAAAAKVGQH